MVLWLPIFSGERDRVLAGSAARAWRSCRKGPVRSRPGRQPCAEARWRRPAGRGILLILLAACCGVWARASEKRAAAPPQETRGEAAGAVRGPAWNVLLFTIDSCNASRMSLYGNRIQTTPNLDRWAERATVFEQAHSVSGWTAPGLASLFSGTLPGVHGVDSRDRPPDRRLPTLFKVFSERGYQVPNLNFFTFAPYYQNIGLPPVDRRYFTQNDGDELLNYLDENAERPFFIWYHTTKVHQPYHPPEDALKKIIQVRLAAAKQVSGGGKGSSSEESIDWEKALKTPAIEAVSRGAIVPQGSVAFQASDLPALQALYDAEIYRMDAYFGQVLEALRRKGVEERTLIVVTADHGEELLEHGFVGHASTALQARLFDEVTRIPLIVALPRQAKGRRITGLVQQIDIAPTILDLLGMPANGVMQGKSLKPLLAGGGAAGGGPPEGGTRSGSGRAALAAVTGPALFLESVIAGNQTTKEREDHWVRGIRSVDFKYIQEARGSEITGEYLFDLKRDPAEQTDLAKLRLGEVQKFRKQVARVRAHNDLWRRRNFPPQAVADKPAPAKRECPIVELPSAEETLDYQPHTGAMLFQWTGDAGAEYTIEYDIGAGDHHVAGRYETKGNYQVLGPFPRELWISLKAWNPFRIRVAYKDTQCWSEWRTFYF